MPGYHPSELKPWAHSPAQPVKCVQGLDIMGFHLCRESHAISGNCTIVAAPKAHKPDGHKTGWSEDSWIWVGRINLSSPSTMTTLGHYHKGVHQTDVEKPHWRPLANCSHRAQVEASP